MFLLDGAPSDLPCLLLHALDVLLFLKHHTHPPPFRSRLKFRNSACQERPIQPTDSGPSGVSHARFAAGLSSSGVMGDQQLVLLSRLVLFGRVSMFEDEMSAQDSSRRDVVFLLLRTFHR